MEADTKQTPETANSFDPYQLVAWFHANIKPVLIATAAVAVVGSAWGFYNWKTDQDESAAAQALSSLAVASTAGERAPHPSADALLGVAMKYSGTRSATYAELLAARTYFVEGDFKSAKTQFTKFLGGHASDSLAPQAEMGIAASMEALKETEAAVLKYKEIITKYPGELGISSPVKLTLARLCEESKQYTQAIDYYQQLASLVGQSQYDPWFAEAALRMNDLLAKHPELAKNVVTISATGSTPAPVAQKPAAK